MEKTPLPSPVRPNAGGKPAPVFRGEDLFAGGKVIVILHAGREYQLRITHSNKLILTA